MSLEVLLSLPWESAFHISELIGSFLLTLFVLLPLLVINKISFQSQTTKKVSLIFLFVSGGLIAYLFTIGLGNVIGHSTGKGILAPPMSIIFSAYYLQFSALPLLLLMQLTGIALGGTLFSLIAKRTKGELYTFKLKSNKLLMQSEIAVPILYFLVISVIPFVGDSNAGVVIINLLLALVTLVALLITLPMQGFMFSWQFQLGLWITSIVTKNTNLPGSSYHLRLTGYNFLATLVAAGLMYGFREIQIWRTGAFNPI